MTQPTAPEVLQGGSENAGDVRRIGEAVVRPVGPWNRMVHGFLRHLRSNGFYGCPEVLGLTTAHEVLGYIPGDVAIAPLPRWSTTREAGASVARLVRRFHDSGVGFEAEETAGWAKHVPEYVVRDGTIGHNDLVRSNVVFRDGEAYALIDFDRCAPSSRAYDLSVLIGQWVPLTGVDYSSAVISLQEVLSRIDAVFAGYEAVDDLRAEACRLLPLNELWNERLILDWQAAAGGAEAAAIELGPLARTRARLEWLTKHSRALIG